VPKDKALLPSREIFCLCEAVYDLAIQWEFAPVAPEDSRERVRLAIEWARDFERYGQGARADGDYMDAIDHFFCDRYLAWLSKHRGALERGNEGIVVRPEFVRRDPGGRRGRRVSVKG